MTLPISFDQLSQYNLFPQFLTNFAEKIFSFSFNSSFVGNKCLKFEYVLVSSKGLSSSNPSLRSAFADEDIALLLHNCLGINVSI